MSKKEYIETTYPEKLAYIMESSQNTKRNITINVYTLSDLGEWELLMTIHDNEIVRDSFYYEENMCVGDDLEFGQTNANLLKFRTTNKISVGSHVDFIYSTGFYEKAFKEQGAGTFWNGVDIKGFDYRVNECNLVDPKAEIYEIIAYGKSDIASYEENEKTNDVFEAWKNNQLVLKDINAKLSIKGIMANIFPPSVTYEWTQGFNPSLSTAFHEMYTYETTPRHAKIAMRIYFSVLDITSDANTSGYYGAPYNVLYKLNKIFPSRAEAQYFYTLLIWYDMLQDTDGTFEHILGGLNDTLTNQDWENCMKNGFEPFVSYYVDYNDDQKPNASAFYKIIGDEEGEHEYIYPAGNLGAYTNASTQAHTTYRIVVPTRIELKEDDFVRYSVRFDAKDERTFISVSKYIINNPEDDGVIEIRKQAGKTGQGASFNTDELLKSKLEAEGKFGFFDTSGYTYDNVLNKRNVLYPQNSGIYPDNTTNRLQGMSIDKYLYSKIEIGEKTTPYGYIRVRYRGVDDEIYESTVKIGDGRNVYVMRNNALLLGYSWEYRLLRKYIEDNLSRIANYSYYPVKLSSKGLGYIQIGDEIMIETDKGWINTFVMSRTLTGDKYLKDEIVSSDMPINRNTQKWIKKVDYIERG